MYNSDLVSGQLDIMCHSIFFCLSSANRGIGPQPAHIKPFKDLALSGWIFQLSHLRCGCQSHNIPLKLPLTTWNAPTLFSCLKTVVHMDCMVDYTIYFPHGSRWYGLHGWLQCYLPLSWVLIILAYELYN